MTTKANDSIQMPAALSRLLGDGVRGKQYLENLLTEARTKQQSATEPKPKSKPKSKKKKRARAPEPEIRYRRRADGSRDG